MFFVFFMTRIKVYDGSEEIYSSAISAAFTPVRFTQ